MVSTLPWASLLLSTVVLAFRLHRCQAPDVVRQASLSRCSSTSRVRQGFSSTVDIHGTVITEDISHD